MDFAAPFSDGPGDDFAILTGSFWGPLASAARFEFLFDGLLQTVFTRRLGPASYSGSIYRASSPTAFG
jgi:hypothetical protein